MATDSILHNFIISKPETVQRLADIIENTEIRSTREPLSTPNERELTNDAETESFMNRFKKYER